MSIDPVKFIPIKAIDTDDFGIGGKGAVGTGLPNLSGKAGAFAKMLQGVLKSGGADGLDLTAQATLGGEFLSVMQGQDMAKLAQTSEMNMLMDALDGTSDKAASGGMDFMKLMGGLGVNTRSLDMMGLMGSALPMGLDTQQMTRVMDALKQAGANPPLAGSGFGALADASGALDFLNQAANATDKTAAGASAQTQPAGGIAGPSQPEVTAPDQLPDVAAPEGPEAPEGVAEPQDVPAPKAPSVPLPGGPADATLQRMLRSGALDAPSASLSAARSAMARKAYGGNPASDPFGMLSARFESGGDPGAVGFDRVGGTSYGIYQISSRAGTFDSFLSFLDKKAPDMAERLRAAGSADTGSKTGPMPAAWKTLAHEQSGRFSSLQHEFIRETHFQPALAKVAEMTGIDLTGRNQAIAQMLWSTAVQHGASGSARIFAKALEAVGSADSPGFEKDLVKAVYENRSRQFGSSSEHVQDAVSDRFRDEMRDVMSLLGGASILDSDA